MTVTVAQAREGKNPEKRPGMDLRMSAQADWFAEPVPSSNTGKGKGKGKQKGRGKGQQLPVV